MRRDARRDRHRWCVAAVLVAMGACAKDAQVVTRTVTTHAPACAPLDRPYALFYPFGDFQPQSGEVASLPLGDVGSQIAGMPVDTRELVLDVTTADDASWRAHAAVAAAGDLDLLLLPFRSPCALTDAVDARIDAALGAIDPSHVLLAGGRGPTGGVPTTALVDLARGTVAPLAAGLLVPRAHATVTSWAGGAIVAGGERPDSAEGVASAEVLAMAVGDFDGAPIALSEARTHHGAVVLASGETLLVGGRGTSGVLGSTEIVDAVSRRARTAGLASLVVPRVDPVVLRLASGEIFVAGGFDASGAPVPTLEWLAPDARSASRRPRDLVASLRRAFVALDAGGVLAVVAPDASAAPGAAFQSTWVVSADGALAPAASIDGTLGDVRLFAGPEQAPLLWTGDRWLVWQPWAGAFAALNEAVGAPGPSGDPATIAEPGLALWADGTTVRALRFGTRGPYASTPVSRPLLATDTAFTAPDRLAPAGGPIRFDAASGLTLEDGASVFVTDATFARFALDVTTPTRAPVAVVLRDDLGAEVVLGARACPVTPGGALHVERDGAQIRASVDGGQLIDCVTALSPAARVHVGVRGVGTSVVRALTITRI